MTVRPTLLIAAVMAGILLPLAAPATTFAATFHVRRVTFPLVASSERGLLAELRRKGPLVNGRHAFARTRMKSSVRTRFAPRGGKCVVTGVDIKVSFTMLTPRALNAKRLPRAAQRRWRSFARRLLRHEQRHVAIWKNCARKAQERLRRLSTRSCSSMAAAARRTWRAVINECNRIHDAFDRKESHAATGLPFVRAALGLNRRGTKKTRRSGRNKTRRNRSH